jgi:hypothetical protein
VWAFDDGDDDDDDVDDAQFNTVEVEKEVWPEIESGKILSARRRGGTHPPTTPH